MESEKELVNFYSLFFITWLFLRANCVNNLYKAIHSGVNGRLVSTVDVDLLEFLMNLKVCSAPTSQLESNNFPVWYMNTISWNAISIAQVSKINGFYVCSSVGIFSSLDCQRLIYNCKKLSITVYLIDLSSLRAYKWLSTKAILHS